MLSQRSPEKPNAPKQGKLEKRNFKLLLIGSATSSAGDALTFVVFGFLAFTETQSTAIYSATLVCHFVPKVLGSIFSGPFVDSRNPVKLIVYSDLFRAASILTFVITSALMGISYWGLFILAFCNGLAEAWFTPASNALLTKIVPKESLGKSLALLEGSNQTFDVLFKAIGGVLVNIYRPIALLAFDGLSFGASAFLESKISLDNKLPLGEAEKKESLASQLRAGYLYLLNNSSLAKLLTLVGTLNFFAVPGLVLLLPLLSKKFDESVVYYGYALSSMAIGNIVGSIAFGKIQQRNRYEVLLSSVFGFSLSWILIASQNELPLMLVLIFLAGICQSLSRLTLQSTLLETLDPRFVGRATAIQMALIAILIPVGMLLSGFLGELFSPHLIITSSYIACCALACWLLARG